MGLTIHWDWHGPKSRDEAQTVIEQLRQRALDLPFESVSEVVSFRGDDATFHRGAEEDEFGWLKVQASHIIWNDDYTTGWDCKPRRLLALKLLVAPGSEPMEVILATYPKTIQITDKNTGRRKRLRTGRHDWSGRGFTKTQYASDPQCGGIPEFPPGASLRLPDARPCQGSSVSSSRSLTKAGFLRSGTFNRTGRGGWPMESARSRPCRAMS